MDLKDGQGRNELAHSQAQTGTSRREGALVKLQLSIWVLEVVRHATPLDGVDDPSLY